MSQVLLSLLGPGLLRRKSSPHDPLTPDQDSPHEELTPEPVPHREGKAPIFEPYLRTAADEDIRVDSDFADPNVVLGLLKSEFLPSHQKCFEDAYVDNLSYLMVYGMADTFQGLMQVIMAKRLVDAEGLDPDQTAIPLLKLTN